MTKQDIREKTSKWMQTLFDKNILPKNVTDHVSLLSKKITEFELKNNEKITMQKLKILFIEIEKYYAK